MGGSDAVVAIDVGDGARDLEDAMIAASRERQCSSGLLKQSSRAVIDDAVGVDPPSGSVGITGDAAQLSESLALSGSRADDALSYGSGRFRGRL